MAGHAVGVVSESSLAMKQEGMAKEKDISSNLPTGTELKSTGRKLRREEIAVVILLVVSVIINYVDRSNLSIAAPIIQQQLSLSPVQLGALISAFFWTYALLQLSGVVGWVSDRFPVSWVLVVGYVVWSVATIATGLMSTFATLFATRLLLGVGESAAYPCYSRIFAELPQQHRGRANAWIDAGTKLGPAIGAYVGGILLIHMGWRMLFLVLGTTGLLWLVPWLKVMPKGRPTSEKEKVVLPPISSMLRLPSAWGTFLGHFCGNYFFYFLLAWLPNYLVREEHLSIRAMSRLSAALFLLIAASTIAAGTASDWLIGRGHSVTGVRKSVAAGGLTLASVLILLAFGRGSALVSLSILALSCIGYGSYASNHWAISQTLAGPAMAGRWTSLQNGVANFSGIAAPWVAGWIVQRSGSSRLAFVVSGAVALLGAFLWGGLVRRVEPVDWEAVGLLGDAQRRSLS